MPSVTSKITVTGPRVTAPARVVVAPVPGRRGLCQRPWYSQRPARRPPFADRAAVGLSAAKVRRPVVRPGAVARWRLVDRLAAGQSPVVSLAAPAGYGKTMLLAQWAERSRRRFAWVSLDEGDNDPEVLLTYVAAALAAAGPVSGPVPGALALPAGSVPGPAVRLGQAFSSMTSPVVLVLDDVQLLRNPECQAVVSLLARHVPAGSRLVLAGRSRPPLPAGRLRADNMLLEIGPGELSFTRQEASSLLRTAGVTLGADEVAELHRRTEGWAAGLYLAALSLREDGSPAAAFGGDDRFVSEYMQSELLAPLPAAQRAFLTRAAVLERLCGPLCDAVLGHSGSAATLAQLAGPNTLLVPLDHRGQWYRYHHLFRDMLLADLERTEPGTLPALRRRAAAWCLANDLPEEAQEYSTAPQRRDQRGPGAFRGPALTAAELRLLPLLSTHLSFPQIAAERFLSPNTIKTQAVSIYRKLGVSNRSAAVTRARELGLAQGSAQPGA